jgi:hypothetical protein
MSPPSDRIQHTLARHRGSRYFRVSVVGGAIVLVASLLVGVTTLFAPKSWTASFPARTTLVTNERAYSDPGGKGVTRSDDWIVTSGSLFSKAGAGWTGPIDGARPDPRSQSHTGSAVFRAVTRRSDFRDVTIDFDLYINTMTTTRRTGAHAYDGVHVFLRYHNPQALYTVSVDRRDRIAVIKIKRPGGSSNGGIYTTLGYAPLPVPVRRWVHERVRVANEGGGVRITLWSNGREILNVLSSGSGSRTPLTTAGRVGIRGDNTEFLFRNFTVSPA